MFNHLNNSYLCWMKFRFVFLLCILAGFISCKNDLAKINSLLSVDDSSIEVIKGVDMLYSDSAKVRVHIVSPVLNKYINQTKPYEEFPHGISVEFIDDYQNVYSKLTAKYAIRMNNDNRIIIRDSIVMFNYVTKTKLETSELIWDQTGRKIYNNKFAKISNPKDTLFGYSFFADQDFSYYEMRQMGGNFGVDAMKGAF